MSDALEVVWIDNTKPEMGDLCWRDNIFFVGPKASASGVGFENELLAYYREDRVQTLIEVLELTYNNLMNLQPKIANGLVHEDWIPVFDAYIDPVIEAAETTISDFKKEIKNDHYNNTTSL